jgi:2-polyprenyl-3-methyl-5-hydroxy-6-metoxy-1,4-benzoquinol methylase
MDQRKTSRRENDQVETGLRSVLSHPVIYKTFQRIIGIDRAFKILVNEIIKPTSGSKMLDIGCGEAHILDFLPKGITYVGYDLNPAYINYARKKYADRGVFINERVSEMVVANREPFNIVLAAGLLHHLNDEEAEDLFRVGYNCLETGGFMFTSDNCYLKGQSPVARYISSKDRGQHVRYPEQYKSIGLSVFRNIDTIIKNNMVRIPQTTCILKCKKE